MRAKCVQGVGIFPSPTLGRVTNTLSSRDKNDNISGLTVHVYCQAELCKISSKHVIKLVILLNKDHDLHNFFVPVYDFTAFI